MRSINLLPPEDRRKATARRRQALWVLLAVGYLALLGALWFLWQGQVGDAEDERDGQLAENARIQTEIAGLQALEDLRITFEGRVGVIQTILERDVEWGRVLNDLGRMIPPRVWLGSFTGSVDPASEAGVAEGLGPETIGQIEMSGTAFDYPDVASWLRSLDSTNFPGVAQTWVSSVGVSDIGPAIVVDFTSATFLTDAALSSRVAERVPELP